MLYTSSIQQESQFNAHTKEQLGNEPRCKKNDKIFFVTPRSTI